MSKKRVNFVSVLLLTSILATMLAFSNLMITPVMGQNPKTTNPTTSKYQWPMFGRFPNHTKVSDSPPPLTNATEWKFNTTGPVHTSPVVDDGVVYVGDGDCLSAVYEYNGTLKWKYETQGDIHVSSIAVSDDLVFIGDRAMYLYALNKDDGTQAWNYSATGEFKYGGPTIADGLLYTGCGDQFPVDRGWFYCFYLNGTIKWSFNATDGINNTPAVVDGIVYFGTRSGSGGPKEKRLYAFNASTGTQIWNWSDGNSQYNHPTVADGMLFTGTYANKIYALNASDGTKIWDFTTEGAVKYSSPAVADGRVFAGDRGGNFFALNESTGEQLWNFTSPAGGLGEFFCQSPAIAGDMVFIGSEDNYVYAFNTTDGDGDGYGDLVWKYKTGDDIYYSSPAIVDGVLFIGSRDNYLYAIGDFPPIIGTPSRLPEGDVLPDQEVKVSVNVTDAVSGVKNVTLSYTIDNGTSWTDLPMINSTGPYEATIPGQPAGTWVKYKIIAYDNAENQATRDGTEPYCAYLVISEFQPAIIPPLLMASTLISIILTKKKLPRKPNN